jgi:glycerol kinase
VTDCILAIDAGTTGITALLIDHDGAVQARGYSEVAQYYPHPGWVEHDAEEIWQAVLHAAGDALAAAPAFRPVALGITNQRETMLFWERRSGRPVHRAIVWQCRRSAAICEELRAAGLEGEVSAKTGLRFDPYFSGTKALWLNREDGALRLKIAGGELCFGTIDSWLAWKLSGGRAHATDVTNASRTLCFDIHKLDWDDGLLDLFGLRRAAMPQVHPSSDAYGETVAAGALPGGLPIAAIAGDQQAALFGQGCFEAGLIKATYGTGCFILMHTGSQATHSSRGLLTTIAATTKHGERKYALEGSIFIAGAAVQWLRDNLGIIASSAEGEAVARSVEDSGGVIFVPALAGLGSPHWAPQARGAIYGLSGATSRAHIVRATMESMVFQAQDVLDVMASEAGVRILELRVDGGAAANDMLMQMQADLSGVPVLRPESVESTAIGAAYLAGLATGFWGDETELASLRRGGRQFQPGDASASRLVYGRWRTAIRGLIATDLQPL